MNAFISKRTASKLKGLGVYQIIGAFMVRISKDYSELLMTYGVTILAAFFCIEFIPHDTGLQPIHGNALQHLYTSRLLIAALLTVYISVLILRVNRGNENLILEEKRFSDSIYNTSLDARKKSVIPLYAAILTHCTHHQL